MPDVGQILVQPDDLSHRVKQLAEEISRDYEGRELVLVAITGWGQEEDRRRSREAGFDAHLTKPVDMAALSRLLAELPKVAV